MHRLGCIAFASLALALLAPALAQEAAPPLPDLFTAVDGTRIITAEEWQRIRRPEILELFRNHVYGRAPVGRPAQLSFVALERDVAAFNGKARRTTLDIVYGGPGGTGRFPLRVYSPPAGVRPKGILLMIVNRGRPIIDDAETKPQPYWAVQQIVARGYVAAAFSNGDVAPDDKADNFKTGVFPVFDPPGPRAPDAWGAVAAWAWGASRAIDCLETDPELKGLPIVLVGHSRGGKTALWCGAQDERVALTISNDSGSTGAALARTKQGETIAMINRAYPHWFATKYKKFNDREADLPVDQHMLIAAIAPRLVYVAAAFDNHRADPLAQFRACVEAGPVYRLLGRPDLGTTVMPDRPDVPLHTGALGYHAHTGLHYLGEIDWRFFMDYADRHLGSVTATPRAAVMEHRVIDDAAPLHLWGKSAGDLNADGRPDLLVGGWMGGGLVWYENPSWQKRAIDGSSKISTDIEVADVDRDGKPDVIAIVGKAGPVWYRNPDWKAHPIVSDLALHDIEVADFDGDGDVDIIGRNQNWSERTSGAELFLFRQKTPEKWTRARFPIPNGEGLASADIDGDGDRDIIVNGEWLENPRDLLVPWAAHAFAPTWTHGATFVATGDINGDGRPDIVLTPSEKAGTRYRISWFEAPADPKRGWIEHVLEPDVETVYHFVGVADFNRDGHVDIATAAMAHGAPPTNVTLYLNHGAGGGWTKQVIGTEGSHSMRIVDLDGAGAPSLLGANYRTNKVELWRNLTPAAKPNAQ